MRKKRQHIRRVKAPFFQTHPLGVKLYPADGKRLMTKSLIDSILGHKQRDKPLSKLLHPLVMKGIDDKAFSILSAKK